MNPLHQRRLAPEIMDQPGLDAIAHARALAGLARINRVSGTASFLWRVIRPHLGAARSASVLDLACGRGDVGIGLVRLAARTGVRIELLGLDSSATAVKLAAARARLAGVPARFVQQDVVGTPLPGGYDVVMATLFLHHLDRGTAVALVARMQRSACRVAIIEDLVRGRRALAVAWVGCRLLSRSPVVHADGPASVRAAFTAAEMHQLAHEAGVSDALIRRHWPFRVTLVAAVP